MTSTSHRNEPNWVAIEPLYRAGFLSGRKIAKMFGVPLTTLQRHAKKRGWIRADLAHRVRQATNDRLTQDEPKHQGEPQSEPHQNGSMQGIQGGENRALSFDGPPSRARTRDLEALVSRLQRDVITDQVKCIIRLSAHCDRLLAEGEAQTAHIDVILAEIEDSYPGDKNRGKREAMKRAVSHTSRVQGAASLVAAMERLVKLERQAYRIDDQGGGEQKAATLEERIKQYEFEDARDAALKADDGRVVQLDA